MEFEHEYLNRPSNWREPNFKKREGLEQKVFVASGSKVIVRLRNVKANNLYILANKIRYIDEALLKKNSLSKRSRYNLEKEFKGLISNIRSCFLILELKNCKFDTLFIQPTDLSIMTDGQCELKDVKIKWTTNNME